MLLESYSTLEDCIVNILAMNKQPYIFDDARPITTLAHSIVYHSFRGGLAYVFKRPISNSCNFCSAAHYTIKKRLPFLPVLAFINFSFNMLLLKTSTAETRLASFGYDEINQNEGNLTPYVEFI